MDAEHGHAAPQTNGMGTAGFVVSLVGILSCGIIAPVGLILSLIGLRGQPKGLAIAGTAIGAAGTLLGALVGLGLVVAAVMGTEYVETVETLQRASDVIKAARLDSGSVPDDAEGNALIAEYTDAWGRALRYKTTEDGFQIRSAGHDGRFDSGDDAIHNTTLQ